MDRYYYEFSKKKIIYWKTVVFRKLQTQKTLSCFGRNTIAIHNSMVQYVPSQNLTQNLF